MDKRDSDGFFSTRLVHRDSDNMTDLIVTDLTIKLNSHYPRKLLGFHRCYITI